MSRSSTKREAARGAARWLEAIPGRDAHERTTSLWVQVACLLGAGGLVAGLLRGIQAGAPRELLVRDGANLAIVLATVALLRSGHAPLAWRVLVVGIAGNYWLWLAALGLEFNRYELLQLAISLTAMALLLGRRWLWTGFALASAAVLVAALRDGGRLGGAGAGEAVLPAISLPGATIVVMAVLAVLLDRFGLTVREALAAALARERELAAANEALRAEAEAHRRTGAMLARAQKLDAVARLASGVAHDFNNVITIVNTHATLLRDGLRDRPQAIEDLNVILQAGESAAGLTRQLLTFARGQPVEPRALDLNEVVTSTAGMLGRLVGARVRIVKQLTPGLWPIRADAGQLEQIIVNLAVNARDAMPEGGTFTLSTSNVTLQEDGAALGAPLRKGDHVRLRAIDTGSGMPPAVVEQLFEPFFTTKGEGKGMGLGLSTVYGIVSRAGGAITVESAPGRGTTFEVLLPRDRPAGLEGS